MTCKNCNKELPGVGKFCPYCGAAQEVPAAEENLAEEIVPAEEIIPGEETVPDEAISEEQIGGEIPEQSPVKRSKLKPWQWVLIIVCAAALLAVVVGAVLFGAGIDLRPRENDIFYKTSYTADDEALVKNSQSVVATMGGKELTVGELQMHYQNAFFTFYSQSYYYLSYLGLDLAKPLDQQLVPGEESMTWQQYFVEAALDNWQTYVLLELMAEAEGFQVNPELKPVLEGLEASALEVAVAYGYETVEEWLRGEIGVGVTMNDYARYNIAYYTGSDYLNNFYETRQPTQEEIDAYYAENEATFVQSGITKDLGLNSDVRHILTMPEGGTTAEDGSVTFSEEEWAAAYAEAERILQLWKDGEATEDSFTELANAHSDDPGVINNSGLYENINADASYLVEFKEWAIDANRKTGDTDIVKTTSGYHIMYFVEGEDYCSMLVAEQLIAERVKDLLQGGLEEYPLEVKYKKILVGEIKLN